ncbi:hypothetical protein [Myxacorys almedinensis]|uniref:Uncharacterized protein n=1 Tax=Myxacorys almedinensis A TaxID=2690445 RepID=A0A8J8CKJ4_9CYAN|nr:hypothetical protein [Myxacorys almedinensis]NDJ18681.1 hypothetical protein [Myxacorys almedinensis A]
MDFMPTGEYLKQHDIDETAIQITSTVLDQHTHLAPSMLQSTYDCSDRRSNFDRLPLAANNIRSFRRGYLLNARLVVLSLLLVPMAIAPFWLIALLSLPALGIQEAYSQSMEHAFLVTLVSDCAGLYCVIVRHFPLDKN